jgi:hypothetical protein
MFTQPWAATDDDERRDHIICYQYRADRAAERCAGSTSKSPPWLPSTSQAKRVPHADRCTKAVNRQLESKAHALSGLKGHITNIKNPTSEFLVDAYHRLFQIEKSFGLVNGGRASWSPVISGQRRPGNVRP